MATKAEEAIVHHADNDGHFRRQASQFRDWVSPDPNADFPAEKGRYVLYLNLGCPWYLWATVAMLYHHREHG